MKPIRHARNVPWLRSASLLVLLLGLLLFLRPPLDQGSLFAEVDTRADTQAESPTQTTEEPAPTSESSRDSVPAESASPPTSEASAAVSPTPGLRPAPITKEPIIQETDEGVEGCADCRVRLYGSAVRPKASLTWRSGGSTISNPSRGERYELEVLPEDSPIEKIVFNDMAYDEVVEVGLDVLEEPQYRQSYAIDPTRVDFTDAEVTVTAKGRDLYKCKEYDFPTRTCYGEWVWQRSLTPGEEYTFLLTAEDPAYGEGDSEATVDWAYSDSCSSCGSGDASATSAVQSNDASYATTGAKQGDIGYVLINWTNSFSNVYINAINATFEYGQSNIGSAASLSIEWYDGSWNQLCTDSSISRGSLGQIAWENSTCALSSSVDTVSELNDIKMRLAYEGASTIGESFIATDVAWLEMDLGYYPVVQSANITPESPSESDDLNCTFNITDSDTASGTANVSWFKNGAYDQYEIVGWDNNTLNWSILDSGNTSAGENWSCRVVPTDGFEDGTAFMSSNVSVSSGGNNAPTVSGVVISSNESTNHTREDLSCNATISDSDGDTMNVTVRWYRNNALFLAVAYENDYPSGTQFNATLGSRNTTYSSSWNCSIQAFDGTENSSEENSSALAIVPYATSLSVFDQEQDNESESQSSDSDVYVNEWTKFYANYTSDDGYDIGEILYLTNDLTTYGPVIRAVDVNDDGKRQELVYGGTDSVYAYYPNGTLAWQSTNSSLNNGMGIAAGDFTGDGTDEIAILQEDGHLVIYNASNGAVLYTSPDIASGYRAPRALMRGDIDDDGNSDDLVAGGNAIGGSFGIAAFIYNETSDQFENWWNSTAPADDVVEIQIQALEGGENLIGIATEYQGDILFYYGNGTLKWQTSGDLGTVDSLTFIDLDADGVKDEVAVGEDHELRFINSDGSENSTLTQTSPRQRIWEIVAYDADNDGTDDGVILGDQAMELYAYNYSGDLQWRTRIPPRDFEVWWYDPGFHSFLLADVNNDGRDELLAGQDQPFLWTINTSNGDILGRHWFGYESDALVDYPVGDTNGANTGIDIVDDVNNDGVADIGYARSEGYMVWIQQVECVANISGSAYNMYWNDTSGLWELELRFNESLFSRSVYANETLLWNVTCAKGAYETQTSGTRNITVQLKNTTLDAFDQEDDAEDKSGWLSESAVGVNETTTFFVNYTDLTENTSVNALRLNDTWFSDFDTVYDVDAFDSDADGIDDAFAYGAADNVQAYFFNGTEVWNAAASTYDTVRMVIADDFDGDGGDEIAFTSSHGEMVILNRTDGGEIFKSDDYGIGYALGTGDVNDDGNPDILFGASAIGGSAGLIIFFFNETSGQYEQLWNATDLTGDAQEFAVAEIPGQNLVAVADGGSKNTYVYYANGTLAYSTGSLGWALFAVAFIDYDEDGIAEELLTGGSSDNYVFNSTGGTLDTHSIPSRPAMDLVPFDYDGNGYANEYLMYEQYYLRMIDTDGSTLWSYFSGANFYATIQIADVNRDGYEEFILFGGHDATIYVFNQSGVLLHKESVLHGETLTQSEVATTGGSQEYGAGTGFALSSPGTSERLVAYTVFDVGGGILRTYPRCRISFNDSVDATMSYNSSAGLFYYGRNFSTGGSYDWNVTCESLDHVTQSSGTKQVNVSAGLQCGSITSNTNMTENISTTGSCFTIGADNIYLDCNGYTISSDDTGAGIVLSGRTGVDIRNCVIQDFSKGLTLASGTTRTNLTNITFTSNIDSIEVTDSDDNNFTDISITQTQSAGSHGMLIENSDRTRILNATFDLSNLVDRTIDILGGSLNTNLTILEAANTDGTYGINNREYSNNSYFDCGGKILSGAPDSFYVTNSYNLTFRNCIFNNTGNGIYFSSAGNNLGENLTFINASDGVSGGDLDGSTFSNLNFTDVRSDGILIGNGADNNQFLNISSTTSVSSNTIIRIDLGASSDENNFTLLQAEGEYASGAIFFESAASSNTVDCLGGMIRGNGTAGSVGANMSASGNTIQNCLFTGHETAIHLSSASQYLYNITTNATEYGILLGGGGHTVYNLTAENSTYGIFGPSGTNMDDMNFTLLNMRNVDDGFYHTEPATDDRTFIDCRGGSIVSNTASSYGIYLGYGDDVTVQNCVVENVTYGVRKQNANNLTLRNLTVTNATNTAYYLVSVQNSTMENLDANEFAFGIRMISSIFNISFVNVNLSDTVASTYAVDPGTNVTFDNLTISVVSGSAIDRATNLSINCRGGRISGGGGASRGVDLYIGGLVQNCTITGFTNALWTSSADNGIIQFNNISGNTHGINLTTTGPTGWTIQGNIVCSNSGTDVNDGDSNTWLSNFCDTTSGSATCDYPCSYERAMDCGTYTGNTGLARNLSNSGATCITFNATDSTLDCNDHWIDGDDTASTSGIFVYDAMLATDNNTIIDCRVKDYDYGINLQGSDHGTVERAVVTSNQEGIYLNSADNNTVSNLNATDNTDYDIRHFGTSTNNTFTNLSITNVVQGAGDVSFGVGTRTTVLNASISTSADRALGAFGDYSSIDCAGGTITTSAGIFGLDNTGSDHALIANCNFNGFDTGIAIIPDNVTIANVTIANSQDIGLWSRNTDGSRYTNITITDVADCIDVEGSTNTNFTDITVSGCTSDGIYVDGGIASNGAENLTFRNINVTSTGRGIYHTISGDFKASSRIAYHNISVNATGGNEFIFSDQVTVNCSGGSIFGDDSASTYGLRLSGSENDVTGCTIVDYTTGILLDGGGTDGTNITDTNISSVTGNGLHINDAGSTGSFFRNVTICGSGGTDAVDSAVAVDDFANSWIDVTCDTESGGDLCSSYCNGTLWGCGVVTSNFTLTKDLVHPRSDGKASGPVADVTPCLNITGSDLTIDCAGHSITGPGYTNQEGRAGVEGVGVENVTIRDCYIEDFYVGANFEDTNYTTLENVTTNYTTAAIYLLGDGSGTDGFHTGSNLYLYNTVGNALATPNTDNSTFTNVTSENNASEEAVFSLAGNSIQAYNLVFDNTALYVSAQGNTITGISGRSRILLIQAASTSVHCGGTLTGNSSLNGVFLDDSAHSRIGNCTLRNYGTAIYDTSGGDNATFTNITVPNATYGIVWSSDDATFSNVALNVTEGIIVQGSGSFNQFEHVTVNYTTMGVLMDFDNVGNNFTNITLRGSTGSTAGVYLNNTKTTENSGPPFFIDVDEYHAPHDTRFTTLTIAAADGIGIYLDLFDFDYAPASAMIDCAGGVINGTGSVGVQVENLSYTELTLTNCTIKGFTTGLSLGASEGDSVLSWLNVTNATSIGVNVSDDMTGASGSYTFANSYFCGSGTVDAHDENDATWSKNFCDTTSGNARCSYYCNGTPTVSPSTNAFKIRDSSGSVVAQIDEEGYMFISGSKSESQGSVTPPANSFILRNSSKSPVAYISNTGDLVLMGAVTEFTSVTTTGSDLIVRNNTLDNVALIDSDGNMQLTGELYENY